MQFLTFSDLGGNFFCSVDEIVADAFDRNQDSPCGPALVQIVQEMAEEGVEVGIDPVGSRKSSRRHVANVVVNRNLDRLFHFLKELWQLVKDKVAFIRNSQFRVDLLEELDKSAVLGVVEAVATLGKKLCQPEFEVKLPLVVRNIPAKITNNDVGKFLKMITGFKRQTKNLKKSSMQILLKAAAFEKNVMAN